MDVKALPKVKMDRIPSYQGLEWDRKISDPNNPNFWKYGVANLIFLDQIGDKKLLLDLGCGTGGSTLFVAGKTSAEWIIGVDLVRDMIKVAKKNAINEGLGPKISFLVCDGRHLPFKASCFEAIISRGDAFCFLVPIKSAVQELRRIVRPKGVVILEMDNRANWKPSTIISASFRKTLDGEMAYIVEVFTTNRNHSTVSYILDPQSEIFRKVTNDLEFQRKGYTTLKYSLRRAKEENIGIRIGAPTHWPTAKELYKLFEREGFAEVQVMGDGLLMKLLLNGDKTIIEAMKRDPPLFFELEKRQVQYVDPNKAPTIILRATAP